MNEKKNIFLFIFIGIFIGSCITGFAAYQFYGERSPGEVSELSQRHDQLDREYTERQRIIEDRQRSIESGIAECIEYAENTGRIIERTGENTGRAIGNLTEAITFIEQGIKEREALKMELNSLRAGLYGIRDMVRDEDNK